jgi:hypothetical protein
MSANVSMRVTQIRRGTKSSEAELCGHQKHLIAEHILVDKHILLNPCMFAEGLLCKCCQVAPHKTGSD